MRRSWLVMCALLAGTTLGCAKIKEALNKRRNRNQTPATQTATRDTTKTPATPAAPAGVQPPPVTPPPSTRPAASAAIRPMLQDEPYNSADTGTIAPGMGENDVVTLWGPPSAIRHAGSFTYLHYPNGCEHSCGTDDVVILQDGQVVDAIVRWSGHGYSGQSSSPPGRTPMPTLQ